MVAVRLFVQFQEMQVYRLPALLLVEYQRNYCMIFKQREMVEVSYSVIQFTFLCARENQAIFRRAGAVIRRVFRSEKLTFDRETDELRLLVELHVGDSRTIARREDGLPLKRERLVEGCSDILNHQLVYLVLRTEPVEASIFHCSELRDVIAHESEGKLLDERLEGIFEVEEFPVVQLEFNFVGSHAEDLQVVYFEVIVRHLSGACLKVEYLATSKALFRSAAVWPDRRCRVPGARSRGTE